MHSKYPSKASPPPLHFLDTIVALGQRASFARLITRVQSLSGNRLKDSARAPRSSPFCLQSPSVPCNSLARLSVLYCCAILSLGFQASIAGWDEAQASIAGGDDALQIPVESLPSATALLRHDRGSWTEGLVCSLDHTGAVSVWESTGMWKSSRLLKYAAQLRAPRIAEAASSPSVLQTVHVSASARLPGNTFGEGLALRPADGLLYQGSYTSGTVLRWDPASLASRGVLQHPQYPSRLRSGNGLLRFGSRSLEDGEDGDGVDVPFAALDAWLHVSGGEATAPGSGMREVWGLAWDSSEDVLLVSNGTLDVTELRLGSSTEDGSRDDVLTVRGTLRVEGVRREDARVACSEPKSAGEPWWPLRINELEHVPVRMARALRQLRVDVATPPPSWPSRCMDPNQTGAELWAAVQGCTRGILRVDSCSGAALGWLRLPWADTGRGRPRGDLNGIAVCNSAPHPGRRGSDVGETVLLVTGKNWGAVHVWKV